jgi:hypothetical protein
MTFQEKKIGITSSRVLHKKGIVGKVGLLETNYNFFTICKGI